MLLLDWTQPTNTLPTEKEPKTEICKVIGAFMYSRSMIISAVLPQRQANTFMFFFSASRTVAYVPFTF